MAAIIRQVFAILHVADFVKVQLKHNGFAVVLHSLGKEKIFFFTLAHLNISLNYCIRKIFMFKCYQRLKA